MKFDDLELPELLKVENGLIRFADQRALIIDANAMGILRKELVENLGLTAAKSILMRLGYAHGWMTAENFKDNFPWDDESHWRKAGGRIHMLQGHVIVEVPEFDPVHGEKPWAWAVWKESYEAEQHILHLGRAEEPVCWALSGFGSGYMSYATGREVVMKEVKCRGKGDSVCYVLGKFKEDWGDEVDDIMPLLCPSTLSDALANAAEALKKMERKIKQGRSGGEPETDNPYGLIARDRSMCHVVDLANRVAKVDSVVLVSGESGVGKERIAKIIHEESARFKGPFVAVNCGAVTESLLESELFGHTRGAFTGATQDRPGLFEAANGGTLFLDEVGELPLNMQVKLLRVLQEREVRRVGENRGRSINVRLVAATNRDLSHEVSTGAFRKDLYYRLKVIEIRVPPLRERKGDVLPLARHFLSVLGKRMGRNISGIEPSAADLLLRHEWPGNVRELENAIEHAVVLSHNDRIQEEDLPEEIRANQKAPWQFTGEIQPLAAIERDYILAALEANEGNQTKTAKELEIGTATLYRKLKTYQAENGE